MKNFLILTAISLSLFSFEYNFQPKKVSENVWCFLGKLEMPTKENGGAMTNGCYIKTAKGYVVVDSGPSYKYAEYGYKLMSKLEQLPVLTVINTHSHDDHWLGNSYFKKNFNAKLIGVPLQDKNYKAGDKTRMHHLLPEMMENTEILKLDHQVKSEEKLTIGNEEFHLIPAGHGHTKDDIIIYMPKRKVLFTGDLIMNGRITSNRDGSVIGQLKAIEKINTYDYNTLVPGHGHNTGKDATHESKQYFSLLKKRILKAVEDEVAAEDINKLVKIEEFKDHPMYDMLNARNVFDAYGELEFYEEE